MIDRRHFLATLSLGGLGSSIAVSSAMAQGALDAHDETFVPNAQHDQTHSLQAAINAAASRGGALHLPAGIFRSGTLSLPANFKLSGVPGATRLVHAGDGPILLVADADNVTIESLALDGGGRAGDLWHGGLLHVTGSNGIMVRGLIVANTQLNGISVMESSARIEACDISGSALTGLFVYDSTGGVMATGNRIWACANGGIRVWRGANAVDGSIISANRVWDIDWTNGGNGQNGNGINVFRADGVIVSDNFISDCTFSAIRLNTTNNVQIRGNTCLNSGEVAIFSEFTFSGSVIANNIVDNAAAGISMTNFNDDGRLATCTGNVVRNITPSSAVNPDTVPYGIAAEADAVVSANVVENVPGVGILAGWGPYLRDVTIANNLIRETNVGISASVAEGAGAAIIVGNTISQTRDHAMVASRWWEIASTDLAAEANRFANLSVSGNTVL